MWIIVEKSFGEWMLNDLLSERKSNGELNGRY